MSAFPPLSAQEEQQTRFGNVVAMIAADAPQVLRINAAGSPGVALIEEADFAQLIALPNQHLVMKTSVGQVVGYAFAFDRHASYGGEEFLALRQKVVHPFLYVDQIAVFPEARRMGIGNALYGALESGAVRSGGRYLCCGVNTAPPNPSSMAFHRKLGFHPVGSVVTRYGPTVALLKKALNQ